MTAQPIRVLIVDDDELTLHGIEAIIKQSGDMEVLGRAMSADEAVQRALQLRPDVILMDLVMTDGRGGPTSTMSSLRATTRILQEFPEARVLTFSAFEDSAAISELLDRGGKGFVSKALRADKVLEAIRSVGAGRPLPRSPHDRSPATADALSPREREILDLIAAGQPASQIANELHLSVRTVSDYRNRLLQKLSASSTEELLERAADQGLIEPPEA